MAKRKVVAIETTAVQSAPAASSPVPSTSQSLKEYLGDPVTETPKVEDRSMLPFGGLLSDNQISTLTAKTPDKYIYKRQGRGGMTLDYVSIGYVVTVLNKVFNVNGWSWSFDISEVSNMEMVAKTGNIVVKGTLSVKGPVGISRMIQQYGSAEVKLHSRGDRQGRPVDIGDDYKSAGSDALKKCASLLCVANDVYFKDWGAFQDSRVDAEPEVAAPTPTPVATSEVDDATTQARRRIFERVRGMFAGNKEEMVGFLKDITGKDSFMSLESGDMAALDLVIMEPGVITESSPS